MSLIIPPGYGLASWTLDGAPGTGPFVTTMGVDISESQVAPEVLAGFLFSFYEDRIMPRTSNQLTLTRCNLLIGQDGAENGSVGVEGSVTGGSAGADAPVSMSVIVRKVTGTFGRAGRGRMFLPGLLANEEVDINGDIGTAQVTAIQTDVSDFFGDLVDITPTTTSEGTKPVLLHSSAMPPSPVLDLVVARKVGWIRKRIR